MWITVPFLFSLATFFLCEDNKLINLVILYCVVMPFYPSSTKRHETRSLATNFPLFNLDAGSMPTLLDSTVSLPFLITTKKYISVMIHVCRSRSLFLSCMYIHEKFMTE